ERAVAPEIRRDGRLVFRPEAIEDMACRLGMDALGAEQVLDAERNPLERAALPGAELFVAGLRAGAGGVRRDRDIGVELGVRPLDRCEVGVSQLGGGEIAGLEAGTGRSERKSCEIGHVSARWIEENNGAGPIR